MSRLNRKQPGFTCFTAWQSVRSAGGGFAFKLQKTFLRITGRIRTYAATMTALIPAKASMLMICAQVAAVVQSLKLTANWEQEVRQLLHEDQDGADPEAERKEIRAMLRMMRENYEHSLYEGEEFQYWQKVNSFKEMLDLLSRVPESAIDKAARTLLNLRES